jgi:hypothetical protein
MASLLRLCHTVLVMPERSFVILRGQSSRYGCCAKCQLKFLTPSESWRDRVGAEKCLRDKFAVHKCLEVPFSLFGSAAACLSSSLFSSGEIGIGFGPVTNGL